MILFAKPKNAPNPDSDIDTPISETPCPTYLFTAKDFNDHLAAGAVG